mgnify:FL=1
MKDDPATAVHGLLRRLDRAALATVLPEAGGDGTAWPYASLVLVALDHGLAPILLLSDLAEHSKAISADARVSLLFDGTAGLDAPLTGPRVTLVGRAAPADDLEARRRFLARHPDAAMYAGFRDFRFYRVTPERAHLVGGFGKIHWLERDALRGPPLAGLAEAEEGIVAHMNEDHADAVQLYAHRLLKRTGNGWKMTGIDRAGIDLRKGGDVGRLEFDMPLSAVEEARGVLVSLVAKARAS